MHSSVIILWRSCVSTLLLHNVAYAGIEINNNKKIVNISILLRWKDIRDFIQSLPLGHKFQSPLYLHFI